MKYRELGNTGLKVSEIAFGGVSIGLPYANQPMPPEEESIRLLTHALDAGVNFYDTARMYGESEALIGKAFRNRRADVIISTKAAHFLNEDGTIPADYVVRSKIRHSLEESLRTLRTDYVDVFMLHQADSKILENETIRNEFSALKKEGLVRFMGASTYEPEESLLCVGSGLWDVIQMPLNLLDQRHLPPLEMAEKNGVGIIIRSVLFRGMLTGRPLNLHPDLHEVEAQIELLHNWNANYYPDLLTLAVKYVLSYPAVSAALIGMDKTEHLEKAIQVVANKDLDSIMKAELEGMAFKNPELLNLNQWIKKGWLQN